MKRILAIMVSVIMAVSMMPAMAFAGTDANANADPSVTSEVNDTGEQSGQEGNDGSGIAAIGDKQYESLEAAVAEATEGDEIELLADISMSSGLSIAKDLTVNLAGNRVSFSGDNYIYVDGAGLTIEDGRDNKGTIYTENYGIYAKNGGSVTVNGGTVNAKYAALSANNTTGDANFTINDGVLTSRSSEAIYMPSQQDIVINGGTINGGLSVRMGQITITGGTINGMTADQTADSMETYWNYSGSAWIGDAVYVWGGTYDSSSAKGNSCSINISGGTINGNAHNAIAVYNIANKYDQKVNVDVSGTANINGKVVIDDSYKVSNPKNVEIGLAVTGGTFTTDPTAYVPAEGYTVSEDNGTWTVAETHKEAAVGDKKYESLDKAIAEAEAGDEVILLDNVDYSTAKCFDIDKEMTLDLNGKSINAVANGSCSNGGATHFIRVKSGGDLTITDTSDDKSGCITATYGANSPLEVIEIMSGGKFTLAGGKIQNAENTNFGSSSVYVRDGGTFILDGGTAAAVKANASKRACAVFNAGTMKMLSGSIISNDSSTAAVDQSSSSPLEISGGNIDSANKTFISVGLNKAVPVISGGQFSGALNVKWIAEGAVGINSEAGSATGKAAPETYNACINSKLYFTGETGADEAVKALASGDTLTLRKTPGETETSSSFSSGRFTVILENNASFDPKAIRTADGYLVEAPAVDSKTTEYNVVVDKAEAQARVGDRYFVTLGNANVNAKNGDTITLLKDVTGLTSTTSISKELTIDLNGHIIQGKKPASSLSPNGPVIKAYSDVTKLTITDTSENRSGKIENTAASGCAVFADKGSVVIEGGAFIGKDYAVIAGSSADLTVKGGYFLDKSAESYLAEGKTLVESDNAAYTYMAADKKSAAEGEVDLKPAVGDVSVDSIENQEIKDALSDISVSEKALDAAMRGEINAGKVEVDEAALGAAADSLAPAESEDIKVYTQAYLDIRADEENFAGGENGRCILDITPMYILVASTAADADSIVIEGEGRNAAAFGEPQELEVKTTVEVTIPLPEGFATKDDNTVTVKHTKESSDGTVKVYYYPADVESGKATFTNPHGFSRFEVLQYSDEAALDEVAVGGEVITTDADTFEYTVKFDAVKDAEEIKTVTVAPAASDKNAKVKVLVDGREVKDKKVELKLGTTTFNVLVLAEDDTAAIYTIKAVRCQLIDSIELNKTVFTYNGKAQEPAVIARNGKGEALKVNTDYTVSYAGNRTSVGRHTVNAKFKGRYEGTASASYVINPGASGVKSIKSAKKKMTVYMTKKVSSTGGSTYQIAYKQKGTSTWKSATAASASKTIKSLKKGKYYYVKVRSYKKIGSTTYYGAWSKTKLSKKIK